MTTPIPHGQPSHPDARNRRSQLKSDRRLQLLSAAERLFAERGFLAVRLEDIGAAAGVSGPAIYRHFPNKESLLVELLVGISARLGGRAARAEPRAGRSRCPADGARGIRLVELNIAQHEGRRRFRHQADGVDAVTRADARDDGRCIDSQ
jgi:AcrR family transcriptional regulator